MKPINEHTIAGYRKHLQLPAGVIPEGMVKGLIKNLRGEVPDLTPACYS